MSESSDGGSQTIINALEVIMKRIIAVALLALVVLSGCASNSVMKPKRVVLADTAQGGYGTGAEIDPTISLVGSRQLLSPEQSESEPAKTVTIQGKEYTGKHYSVYLSPFYNGDCDEYKCDLENGALYFFVDRAYGEVVYYSFMYNDADIGEMTYEACRDISDSALKEADDSGEYTHDRFNERNYTDSSGCYSFVYYRTMEGFAVYEMIKISVSSKNGQIIRYSRADCHMLDGTERISYDTASCRKAVDDYAADYANKLAVNGKKYNYEIAADYFAKLKDGSYGIIYYVYFKQSDGNDATDNYSTAIKLFVELE